MAVFYGEMNLPGDAEKLPAVVTLDGGRLKVASGRTEIGDWKMDEVEVTEHGPLSAQITVEGEHLVLYLTEHQRFLADTEQYRKRPEKRRRRQREHEAFRRNEEPVETLAQELKDDVSRQAAPMIDEARDLLGFIPGGRPLWIGLGGVLVALILIPGVLAGLAAVGGMLLLVAGGVTYVDNGLAVRLPNDLTPVRLVVVGAALLVAAILIMVVRPALGWPGLI